MSHIKTDIRSFVPREKGGSFERYQSTISGKKYAPKTIEEELKLVQKMHLGDLKAREELINSNLRFVVSIATEYTKDPVLIQDLIQEGNEGLIKAVDRFDDTKGFRLISYAIWWIRKAILKYMVNENNSIKIPMNHVRLIKKIEKFLNIFLQTHNRPPADQEIIDGAQITEDELEKYYYYMKPGDIAGLDNEMDDDLKFGDIIINENSIPPDSEIEVTSLREKVLESIKSVLKPKEQLVIERSLGIGCEPKTDFEMSKILDRTESSIKALRNRALKRLKSALTLSEFETLFNTLNE